MAKIVLRDAFIQVDGVDLSDHASSVTIETKFDLQDATGFGSRFKANLQGLGDATATVNFLQDFDAASVDATLWPLSQSGEPFEIVVKPTSAAVSETNPSYTMQAILSTYNPLDGKVGDVSATQVAFNNAGQDGIVRATKPAGATA
jgi:hypothetical protein